jgi:hypothetical protein
MSTWYLDGERVVAKYFDEVVTGTVESSRVKYGGTVQHTVILDEPITLSWSVRPKYRVLLDDREIMEIIK